MKKEKNSLVLRFTKLYSKQKIEKGFHKSKERKDKKAKFVVLQHLNVQLPCIYCIMVFSTKEISTYPLTLS